MIIPKKKEKKKTVLLLWLVLQVKGTGHWKFSHQKLIFAMPMWSQVKSCSPQNIYGASQQNDIVALPNI